MKTALDRMLLLALLLLASCHSSEQERDQLAAPSTDGTSPRSAHAVTPSLSALRAHAGRIEKQYGDQGFSVVVEPPFVVIGDEPARLVERRSKSTVRWAVDLLKKDFFAEDPPDILEIWLFRNRKSYLEHTRSIFNDKPTTPFGYYSPTHKALIMNIATGGGTLVHEIVHPYMAANFPNCPAWFNEGMGSLFEQCREKDGHIIGLVNWRWTGLKAAIDNKGLRSFESLLHTSTEEFYGEGFGAALRASTLPPALPPGAGHAAHLLQELPLAAKDRPHRLEDPAGHPRPEGHGQVPGGVGSVGADSPIALTTTGLAHRPPRWGGLRRGSDWDAR